jgi:hypothetical protein
MMDQGLEERDASPTKLKRYSMEYMSREKMKMLFDDTTIC